MSIYASTPVTASALHKGPGVYLAAGVGWGRVHEPNPILLAFRSRIRRFGRPVSDEAGWWLAFGPPPWTPGGDDEWSHARRVLARLVAYKDAS